MEELIKECVDLRKNGKENNELKEFLKVKIDDPSQIKQIIKESDIIYLNNIGARSIKKNNFRYKTIVKFIFLILILKLLIPAFLGQYTIGILFLILIFGLIKKNGAIDQELNGSKVFNKKFKK